jgi:hypothetical protein
MNKKMLIVIALVGIGLWALPQTMSLFAGQHSFVNIDATGNQIDCVKCHGDVQAELTSQGVNLKTGTPAPHAAFKCEYCHRIEAGAASGDNAYAIVTYKTGSAMRTIAMTMENFEEENFPTTIKNVNDINADGKTDLSEATSSFVFKGKAAISPPVVGTESTVVDLVLYNEYEKPTYNSATGQPYDTNVVTRNTGLDLSKIPMDSTGWTYSSRYWTPTLLGAGSRVVNPGTEYHAASLVSCLECHGGSEPLGHYSRVLDGQTASTCPDCHYGYPTGNRWTELGAGGFGLLGGSDTGTKEAHKEFALTDDGITRQKDGASNGACVACHTHVAVDITYQKPTIYKFDANFLSDGTESVGEFVVGGSTYTYSGTP